MLTETKDRDAIVANAIAIASASVRAAYIAGACGNDAELKQQVEALVAAHFASASGSSSPGQGLEQAGGATPAEAHEAATVRPSGSQEHSTEETVEAKIMAHNKPRGLVTVGALLVLATGVVGSGVTGWAWHAKNEARAAVQETERARKEVQSEVAEAKHQREEALEARQTTVKERDGALAAATQARQSGEDTRAVLAFLQDKLLSAGRSKGWGGSKGKDVTLRQALDAASAAVAGAFPDRPVVEASIREILATAYLDLGQAEQAVKQYERAFALQVENLGPDDPQTCDCRNKLAVAYREAGQIDEAGRLYDLNDGENKGRAAVQNRKTSRGQSPAPQGGRTPEAAPRTSAQKGQGS